MSKSSAKTNKSGGKRSSRRGEDQSSARQTKKQIALGRREARQNRIIWLSVAALGLLIVVIVSVGLVREVLIRPSTPVALVDGSKIRQDDYQALVRYRRYNTRLNSQELQNGLQALDPTEEGNEFLITFYQQQIEQLQTVLLTIPQTALDELIEDELIRGYADEAGIVVSGDDVEQSIMDDLRRAVSPQSSEPTTDTVQLPTPTPVPQAQLDEFYQNIVENMGLSDREFRSIIQRGLLRSRTQEHLADQIPTTGLVAHAQMIQTDTQEDALAAQERIENGEDVGVVAREMSTDPAAGENGGDLGWITTGQLTSQYGDEWDALVFSLEAGATGLVQGDDTFYVVQVLERDENGPLPDDVLSGRQYNALSEWLAERKSSSHAQIEKLLELGQIPPDPFAGY